MAGTPADPLPASPAHVVLRWVGWLLTAMAVSMAVGFAVGLARPRRTSLSDPRPAVGQG